MKRVVLRGAITFFNINKNRGNDVYYELDDLINELYMTLDNCANKFDTSKGKDFYLYFNSAVSKRVTRLANYRRVNNDEMTFSRYDSMSTNDEDYRSIGDNVSVESFNEGIFWDDIDNMGLSDKQANLVRSLFEVDKKREILKENGLNRAGFEETLGAVREVFKSNYINGANT